MKIKLGDRLCDDKKVVLNKWCNDFHSLLNIPEKSNHDNSFKNSITYHKEQLESEIENFACST